MDIVSRRIKTRAGAYTLLELIVVMGIITALAGISIAVFQSVEETKKEARSKIDIELLASALQAYHHTNGTYPGSDGDAINSDANASGEGNTTILYTALFGDGNGNGKNSDEDDTTSFLAELNPITNTRKWTRESAGGYEIIDAWGNELFYRVGADADNPDFDLWSAGPDGDEATEEDNIVL